MASMKATVDVEAGPVIRTALDVLDFSAELMDAIPEGPTKDELLSRGEALIEICRGLLERKLQLQ